MEEKQVKEGDVVVLKSGSVIMTVGHFTTNDKSFANCYWFQDGTLYDKEFPVVALIVRKSA